MEVSCPNCGVSVYLHLGEVADELYCCSCSFHEKREHPLHPLKPIDRPLAPVAWRQDIIKREGNGTKGGKKKRGAFDE